MHSWAQRKLSLLKLLNILLSINGLLLSLGFNGRITGEIYKNLTINAFNSLNSSVTFNAFNILNGQVFFYKLKSNGLENFKDQRLTEVTFGVMINN